METNKTIFDYYKYDPNKKRANSIVKDTPLPNMKNEIDEADKSDLDTSIQTLSSLSEKQRIAYDKFVAGENMFITGPGGTGKTKLIKHFVEYVSNCERDNETENLDTEPKKKQIKLPTTNIQVCAMTGCAAILLNCNARTIHSWSGIKLAKGTKEEVVKSVIKNKKAMKSWRNTKILVLDEVSMLSKKVFEIIEEIARVAKKCPLPFGGMQVIFSGDFCQLPPVGNYGEPDTSSFCFDSPLWNTLFPISNCIEFTHIFRQTDPVYTKILHGIRKGVVTKSSNEVLLKCVAKEFLPENHNGCIPTKLLPLRSKVDYINNLMFNQLTTKEYVFEITNNNNIQKIRREAADKKQIALDRLYGTLSEIDIQREFGQLTTNSPSVNVLRLKKGSSVMCNINLDIDNCICNGSQGIIIDIKTDTDNTKLVVVKFSNGVIKYISPHHWHSDEYPALSISQYPLCLAWALTIHKIQGATLDLAEIDIGNSIFEYGQTYVALSRVKSLDGLYLSAFEPTKIQTNPSVIAFYKSIRENQHSAPKTQMDGLEKLSDKDMKRIVL